jgi:putative transposase
MLTARESMNLDLWAYVIMPEHVHLLIRPRNKDYKMGHILAALKRPVSAKAKAYMVATNNTSWLDRLTVHEGKQVSFRFWQAGGGYDENLTHERSLEEVIAYIHGNPVRRGLVEQGSDWYWSSARYWEGDLSGPLIMDSLDGSA